MKVTFKTLAAMVLATCFSSGVMAHGEAGHGDHSSMKKSEAAGDMMQMHPAEVKKVLLDKGKITLKHGELKSHNMPPMTMMFKVKDTSMIEGLEKGDQVEFSVDEDLVVQEIKKK